MGAGATSGAGADRSGEVDYRLARAARLHGYRSGRFSRAEVCDAQTELLRNARSCAKRTRRGCPICDDGTTVVDVTYVFGPRLPASGRCISAKGELAALAAKRGRFEAYVVEVCCDCGWNHLVRSFPLTPTPT